MRFTKLTPNLIVPNVEASLDFYCNVLGFARGMTVPDSSPYVFGSVVSGDGSNGVEICFNDQKAVAEEDAALGGKPIGGSLTLFIEVEGIVDFYRKVQQHGVKITMPIKDQFYGMREFGMQDPDGWVITFAERIAKL